MGLWQGGAEDAFYHKLWNGQRQTDNARPRNPLREIRVLNCHFCDSPDGNATSPANIFLFNHRKKFTSGQAETAREMLISIIHQP